MLLSNQSNCYFELGHYSKSIEVARDCLHLLDNETWPEDLAAKKSTLRHKNLLRIARSGIYGSTTSNENVIEPLTELSSCGDAAYEKRSTNLLKQVQMRRNIINDDKNNQLPPIHRASLLGSSVCEYYSFGHDLACSALGPGDPVNEEGDVCSPPIQLQELPKEDLANLAVLFGGVGDARHVFVTLVDAFRQWESLAGDKSKQFHLHLTLNDINPTVLARDILMLEALQRLGNVVDWNDCSNPQKKEAFQLATMLGYTFFGYVMPPSVYDMQMKLIDDLLAKDLASESYMVADK